MKRVKKIFLFVVFMFLGAFTLASCGEEKSSSNAGEVNESVKSHVPSQPALNDDQVKTNFDTYAKSVKLSKASINQTMNQAVAAGSSVNPSEALDKINIPNSKVTITSYMKETKTEEIAMYAWQNDKVIYLAPDQDDATPAALKLDLNEVLGLINSVPTTSDTDYVGMILSLLKAPSGFDVDQYLTKIAFTGDDFTYADGWFTLKNEKIAEIAADIMGADASDTSAMLSQYVSKLEIKIGFDGRYFTGFSFEVDPVSSSSNQYIKASLVLNYEYNLVVGAELKLGANIAIGGAVVDDEYQELASVFADATITANASGVNADVKVNIKDHNNTTIDCKATATTNKDGLSYNMKTDINAEGETNKIEFTVNLTSTKLTATEIADAGEHGMIRCDVDMTLNNFIVESGTVTINCINFDSGYSFDNMVIELATKDVTIPANITAKEEHAVNVMDYIGGKH